VLVQCANNAYETQDFVEIVRETGMRPHVRQFRLVPHTAGSLASTSKDRTIEVNSIIVTQSGFAEVEQHLDFYFTRFSASEVAQKQAKIAPNKEQELNSMPQLVDEAESILTTRQRSVCEFGRLLHESWQIKGTITRKITNSNIDEIFDARRVLAPWEEQLGARRRPTCAVRGTAGVASGAQGLG
jgi:hypothetical protein